MQTISNDRFILSFLEFKLLGEKIDPQFDRNVGKFLVNSILIVIAFL